MGEKHAIKLVSSTTRSDGSIVGRNEMSLSHGFSAASGMGIPSETDRGATEVRIIVLVR